jgi:flagellar biosynthetic protein FliQ
MTPETVMTQTRLAMETMLMVAGPLLLIVLLIGLAVSVFQAATQINESTLSFIPKLLGIVITIVIAGPWMLTVLLDFTRRCLSGIPALVG